MSLSRFLSWCITENGRKAMSYVATGSIVTVTIAHMLPQTVFIENYVDLIHLYKKGFTVPLSNETKEKFMKVLNMLNVEQEQRLFYKPFNCFGFDITSLGASFSRWGIRVGIPANFEYKSVDDIEKHRINLNNEKIVWDTEVGKKLLKSLVLSENAQLYAIAREIRMRETPKLLIDTVCGSSCAFGSYAISQSINKRYNFFTKPLVLRVTMYLLVSAFSLGNYFLIKDFTQVHYEQKIDEELKSSHVEFAEGGKEFYTKQLLRNLCLRELLGKEGETIYTPIGNENYLFRLKTTPLMQRREFFD